MYILKNEALKSNTLKILLIEDDLIEVMKLKRVIKTLELSHTLIEAQNGKDAIEMLQDGENIRPDIIFLDLNMPKINGIEFLKIVKSNESLKYIPTIILTTSNNKKDLMECYKIGIAGYILKPLKYEMYLDKIEKTLAYWSENELIKA